MKIEVLSLFPECFKGFIESSMVARAINLGILKVDLINYRILARISIDRWMIILMEAFQEWSFKQNRCIKPYRI